MTEMALNIPQSDADPLEQILSKLTVDQVRFVIARCSVSTDKEAAKEIGMATSTVKSWKQGGAPIDEALALMMLDGLTTAMHLRRRALGKAMAVKVAGLDSTDRNLRQRVASEIIEWELGKATQRSEVSGPDGEPIEVDDARDKVLDLIARRVATGAEGGSPSSDDGCGSGDAKP